MPAVVESGALADWQPSSSFARAAAPAAKDAMLARAPTDMATQPDALPAMSAGESAAETATQRNLPPAATNGLAAASQPALQPAAEADGTAPLAVEAAANVQTTAWLEEEAAVPIAAGPEATEAAISPPAAMAAAPDTALQSQQQEEPRSPAAAVVAALEASVPVVDAEALDAKRAPKGLNQQLEGRHQAAVAHQVGSAAVVTGARHGGVQLGPPFALWCGHSSFARPAVHCRRSRRQRGRLHSRRTCNSGQRTGSRRSWHLP